LEIDLIWLRISLPQQPVKSRFIKIGRKDAVLLWWNCRIKIGKVVLVLKVRKGRGSEFALGVG